MFEICSTKWSDTQKPAHRKVTRRFGSTRKCVASWCRLAATKINFSSIIQFIFSSSFSPDWKVLTAAKVTCEWNDIFSSFLYNLRCISKQVFPVVKPTERTTTCVYGSFANWQKNVVEMLGKQATSCILMPAGKTGRSTVWNVRSTWISQHAFWFKWKWAETL